MLLKIISFVIKATKLWRKKKETIGNAFFFKRKNSWVQKDRQNAINLDNAKMLALTYPKCFLMLIIKKNINKPWKIVKL